MRRIVDRNDVQRMSAEGAQVVNVLPEKEFTSEHIAGSRSLPLTKLDASTVTALDPELPVIVYCWDYQ